MSNADGSLMRRAAVAACLTLLAAVPARAQQPTAAPSTPELLSRYDFHLSAATLATNDPRFSWDTHFGGDADIVDYVKGRISGVIDYEAVLGSELRAFDPNQGNYTLEASASLRTRRVEFAGIFHHVSRHLSDRAKLVPVAWNIAGARALGRVVRGNTTVDLVGDLGWVTEHATVDYRWSGNVNVAVRRRLTPRTAVYARGAAHVLGVAATSSRHTQSGGSIEVGVHLAGVAAGAELFAGFENRIDATLFDFQPEHWGFVGFRLVRQ